MDRDDEGKFNREYPDEDFISAVQTLPVASTQNVADEVGCSYDLAYRRLQNLEEVGKVEQEAVGGSFVWMIE
jgi:DNA-binding transcriptional regulator YhcF (GntR family)